MKFKLKICGMKLPANIAEVSALEPDYLGFIFYKGSKRYVDLLDPAVVKALPELIKKTGVFVNEEAAHLLTTVKQYGLDAVQLHGDESVAYVADLKEALKDEKVEIIKAFGVDAQFDFDLTEPYSGLVDYFLFDTKTPDHGGSGRNFNWSLLEQYKLDVPYFLSGGIDLGSAEELKKIVDTRLYAVDVNSRFEIEPGLKDIDKLIEFKNMLSY